MCLHGSSTGLCSPALGLVAWHNTSTRASFGRQVLTAMAREGREQGHSDLYWRTEPLQLLQQLDFAVQLRQIQDALCLAVTTSHSGSWSQPWHYPHGKGMPGLESPASAPAAPCLLPDTLGWTTAQGIWSCEHTLPQRYDHNEGSELSWCCSTA